MTTTLTTAADRTVPTALEAAAVAGITLRGRKVTRAKVLAAIAECDRLGKKVFLERHGYRDSVRWHLRHNGLSYPSKAILGVAAGLKADEFFGGAAHTVSQLAALGFHVRNSVTGDLADAKLDFLRRACVRAGLDVDQPAWPTTPVAPVAYFASGSNQPGEIRGLAAAGADLGVAVPEITDKSERELHRLAGSDVQVFVDSGAFSEVKFGPNGPEVVKPMGAREWDRVLGLYERLARSLGDQLWIVAPDRVGCQETSLQRLRIYRDRIAALRDLGVRILVPVQKGALSQSEFAKRIDEALGFDDWLPALPAKKAATTAAEVAAFVRDRKPRHVHLLGLGIRSRQIEAYLKPFVDADCTVSLDSCWITANVGRAGKGRRLTRARDIANSVLSRVRTAIKTVELAIYCCWAGPGLVRA